MNNHRLTVCFTIAVALILLVPTYPAQSQTYCLYNVQIRSDGSAVWTVTQFSNANATIETWESFQQKIFDLVDSASIITHRAMEIDGASLQINTTLSLESKTTEYTFVWRNFTEIQNSEISFGDVFVVNNFFGQLFGDAALQVNYPQDFTVMSVYPPPYERQDELHTLKWARTQDLASSSTRIILTPNENFINNTVPGQTGFVIIALLALGISVPLLGFYTSKKRRSDDKAASLTVPEIAVIETEEDKILKLLKTSGSTMRQSDITERLGFSKAKTSQLLSALEGKGKLARYKKGRDKIVTLNGRENKS
jgi:uncharacterized membrane protein